MIKYAVKKTVIYQFHQKLFFLPPHPPIFGNFPQIITFFKAFPKLFCQVNKLPVKVWCWCGCTLALTGGGHTGRAGRAILRPPGLQARPTTSPSFYLFLPTAPSSFCLKASVHSVWLPRGQVDPGSTSLHCFQSFCLSCRYFFLAHRDHKFTSFHSFTVSGGFNQKYPSAAFFL